MRSVRLRRGVAIFSFVVFCVLLLLTSLYTPDAGTETSQFDSTRENQQDALPLPAAILDDTRHQAEKNRQYGKDWKHGKNWRDGKNWQDKNGQEDKNKQDRNNRKEVRTKERTDTKIVSRPRDVTLERRRYSREIAHEESLNHPQHYRHHNATVSLPKHLPDNQADHVGEGSWSFTRFGPWHPPRENHRVNAWHGPAVFHEKTGAEFDAENLHKSHLLDHRKADRNQDVLNHPKSGSDYWSSYSDRDGVDYRYITSPGGHLPLWPEDSNNSEDDRIVAQLNYIPRTYSVNATDSKRRTRTKRIYVPGGLGDVPSGRRKFIEDGCSVNACALTMDGRFRSSADLVLLQLDAFFEVPPSKPRDQIWVMWLLESPINTALFRNLENVINWTATYRSDSTIVTPYEKFVLNPDLRQASVLTKNHAAGKSHLIAWFVSNCLADNRRWEYMLELRRYVPIDVYGACGEQECQRERETECNNLLRTDYKFYLSFENSNCQHYITEKFFQRALWNGVVPIAMGARMSDYASVAPPHSYIHVEDFASPRHLADYLLKLNASDELYNEYFDWKDHGNFVNTKFWCRLCALLHDDTQHSSWYPDVEKWWRGNATCTRNRWDDRNSLITDWTAYQKSRAKGR